MSAEGVVSIKGLSKAAVLAALYNRAGAQGLGLLHYSRERMTEEAAQTILDTGQDYYFDYLHGRVMKVDLSGEEFSTFLYNRDNGTGAAEAVVEALR